MSCIPIRLCEFPSRELVLTAVYGFGTKPILLLSNLKLQKKKKLCHIITKVYLLRWRIEEYFRFKKQQFAFYAIEYDLERVLAMCRTGISSYLPPKIKSQQITLFEYFKIVDCRA